MRRLYIIIILSFQALYVYCNEAKIRFDSIKNEKNYGKLTSELKIIYDKYPKYEKRYEVGYTLGNIYVLNGKYSYAIVIFNTLIKDFPKKSKEPNLILASIYVKTSKVKEAMKMYQKLINLEEKSKSKYYYEALYGMGNCYFELKSYYEALGNYNRIINSKINFKDMSFLIYKSGLCYEYTKSKENALKFYNRVIKEYPNSYAARLSKERIKDVESQKNEDSKDVNTSYTKYTKPIIYEAKTKSMYQIGRFKEKSKAVKLQDIIKNVGYNAYIKEDRKENEVSYVVRIDLPDDSRNIDELKKRLSAENIAFFKIRN